MLQLNCYLLLNIRLHIDILTRRRHRLLPNNICFCGSRIEGKRKKENGENGNGKRGTQTEKCLYKGICITMLVCIVGLRVDQV